MSKGKKKKLRLESEIQRILRKDNGVTAHFDYRIQMNSARETVSLDLLTFNPIHDEYMLLKKVAAPSAIKCLKEMLKYLKEDDAFKKERSFTVNWKKKDSDEAHKSYFRGKSEQEVRAKFLHEKDEDDYQIEISENPIT